MRVLIVMMTVLAISGSALANTGVVEEVIDGGTVRFGEDFVARFTGLSVPDTSTSIGHMIHDFTKGELEDGARKKEIGIWAGKGTEPGEDSR